MRPFPSIFFVGFFFAALLFLQGCAGKLPAEDVLFISVADACETIGNGLTAASKFKKQMAAEDIAVVDSIIPRAQTICKDRNNPPSTMSLASDGLQLMMRDVLKLVSKYAAKGAMLDGYSIDTVVLRHFRRWNGGVDVCGQDGAEGCGIYFRPRQVWAI